MKFIVGKKREMSQVFKADGTVVPVTIVETTPCVVTQVRTTENDGYTAVQIGYGSTRTATKPLAGHTKDLGTFEGFKEFRVESAQAESLQRGQKITTSVFTDGDVIKVVGTSKGKGFQGVVKRHGFSGQGASHGVKDQMRMPGSSGAQGPQHVFKGIRKPGRMGGDQVTVANLEIVKKDEAQNLLYIKGAVPGARHGLVMILAEGDMNLSVESPKAPEAETVVTTEPVTTPEASVEQSA